MEKEVKRRAPEFFQIKKKMKKVRKHIKVKILLKTEKFKNEIFEFESEARVKILLQIHFNDNFFNLKHFLATLH